MNGGGAKCAVHIRRGDLANGDGWTYGTVSLDYFSKAFTYVSSHYENVKFFLFSDELDWVEENIIGMLANQQYALMYGNNAWEDLALMAQCDCFISSQGSAGKFAAMINGKGVLILSSDSHDAVWKERYANHQVIPSSYDELF